MKGIGREVGIISCFWAGKWRN